MDRVYVMQLVRSFQVGEISRRTFLTRTSAALGSVAAANLLLAACQPVRPETPPPVVAEPAATGTPMPEAEAIPGLTTGTLEYPDNDGQTLTGYIARPESGGPAPAVIVIQEWWGLDEHIRDVTNRFAQQGYVALAPDLYHGVSTTEPDEARKLVMELDMAEAVNEIRQAITYVLDQDYVWGNEVGIVGFCMGGNLSIMTSTVEDRLGAAVAFYGRPLAPEQASDVKVPLLGLYGEEDRGIPIADVRAMEEGLAGSGLEHEITIYSGAGHSFFNDTRQSYNPEAAQDAWDKTLAWFDQYLTS